MAERQVDAAMYARVFEHGEGALVLQDLVARFYDVQVFMPGGVEGERETTRRAARREVVHFVLRRIGQVGEAPPPDDNESPTAA